MITFFLDIFVLVIYTSISNHKEGEHETYQQKIPTSARSFRGYAICANHVSLYKRSTIGPGLPKEKVKNYCKRNV